MKSLKKPSGRTKLSLLLLIILIGGIVFGVLYWMISNFTWLMCLVPVIFLFLAWLARWTGEHTKWRVVKFCHNIVSAPLAIVYIAMSSMKPFITIVGCIFFFVLLGFGIPILFLHGLNYVINFYLQPETLCFITITSASIICANSYRITKMIVRCTPFRNRGNHRYEEYMEKLADYLIQPSNIVFVLYLVYFVVLIIIGFKGIQYGSSLISDEYDSAILKAFLVFTAYTNMKTKAQDTDFNIDELLKLTLGLFKQDDEKWLERRFKSQNDS